MALPVCTIDENGIYKPDYEEVRSWLVDQFQAIFGVDIYIDPDSQDGQQIAIFASAINDANAMAMQVYNSFSPSTGRGVGLSSNVKINGIARRVASFSTVDLLITGQAGATIADGAATDMAGNRWLLPAIVTIPPDGDITVTATAQQIGAIEAAANTITGIGTPTRGWQAVTNPETATAGAPIESDAALRVRQSVSTAIPSLTVFEGTMGAVAGLPGVGRLRGYENDTNVTDADGIPGNTISMVVQGGDAAAIAQAIAAKKTPGTGTYGTTAVDIVDEYGVTRAIRFFRPTAATIKVALNITGMTGYTAAIETAIKQTIVDWVNGLQIGEDVEFAEIYVPANLNGDPDRRTYKITGMTIAKNAGAPGTSDLVIAFNEAATASLADITITVA
ncbi:MAG: hypothetical protein C0458_05435 [Methylobacterium sp.]|nr:hypothetical protein [Methylobacterium sp.]